jgi:hypothetical protein
MRVWVRATVAAWQAIIPRQGGTHYFAGFLFGKRNKPGTGAGVLNRFIRKNKSGESHTNNLLQLSRLIFEIRSSGATLPPISGKFVPQVHSTLGRNTFTFVNAGKYDVRALARIHEITNSKTVSIA